MTVNPNITHPALFSEEALEAGQPAPGPQTPQEAKLLAGKYKNTEELERGYQNLFEYNQRMVDENRQLKESVQVHPDTFNSTGNGTERQNPADRRGQSALDALSMAGVPVDAINQLLEERVQTAVERRIMPIFQGAEARQRVVNSNPEFAQFEGELAQFLATNSATQNRYNRIYSADPEAALQWVWGEFRKGAPSASSQATNGSASGAAQLAARLDATLPGQVTGPRQSGGGINDETYAKLMEQAQRTGNWSRVMAYKLSGIPDSHFDSVG